jgi:hypothetical protein
MGSRAVGAGSSVLVAIAAGIGTAPDLCFCNTIHGQPHGIMQYEQLDRIADQTGNGNVLLKLAGYAKTNPVVENSLSFVYFRTSYALYPRRLYVAPADQVINNGRDMMRIEFSPSQQWLHEHDVRSVFTFGNDNAGGETLRLEILPPRDDQAGMPTNKSGGN